MFFLTGGGYSSAATADVNAKEIFLALGQFPVMRVLGVTEESDLGTLSAQAVSIRHEDSWGQIYDLLPVDLPIQLQQISFPSEGCTLLCCLG